MFIEQVIHSMSCILPRFSMSSYFQLAFIESSRHVLERVVMTCSSRDESSTFCTSTSISFSSSKHYTPYLLPLTTRLLSQAISALRWVKTMQVYWTWMIRFAVGVLSMCLNSSIWLFGAFFFFSYGFVTFTSVQARDDLLKKVTAFDDSQSCFCFHNLLQNYTFLCSFCEMKVTKSQFRKELVVLSVSPNIKLYDFTGLVY